VLEEGSVVQIGSPAEVFRRPSSKVVRDLVRAAEEMIQALNRNSGDPSGSGAVFSA